MALTNVSFIEVLIYFLIAFVPTWKILNKAGFNPKLSFFLFIPILGVTIIMTKLAFSKWPNANAEETE